MPSKIISHGDDASKDFIIKCLKNDKTYGFDVDAIHLLRDEDGFKYYIFEYLKDENKNLSPFKSDPKYYPWNWRKFYSLFKLAKKLNGKLWLINYSDGYRTIRDDKTNEEKKEELAPNYIDEVRVMEVESFDIQAVTKYSQTRFEERPKTLEYMKFSRDEKYTFEQYSKLLREMNKNSEL